MRIVFSAAALTLVLACVGCFWRKNSGPAFQNPESIAKPQGAVPSTQPPANPPASPATNVTAGSTAPIVTPAGGLTGKVSSAYADQRFAVITFPIGQMARPDQRLDVYRAGLKVGELLVTGPQQGESTVADITAGEAQKGDEVRSR